jgi:uncharacterized protein YndB with AHSA1/START domain
MPRPFEEREFMDKIASTTDTSARVSVSASRTIDAPVERLWAEVANFNNVAKWHPDVTESHLEADATGTVAGDVRAIRLRDGTAVRERLLAIDPDRHEYVYSVLDGQLPLKAHRSSVAMLRLDAGRTEVTWEASFEPAGAPADTLAAGVKSGVLELGLQGLADRAHKGT